MPIYDFKCLKCGKEKKDVFTRSWEEIVKCECGKEMQKVPSRFMPDVFPAEGLHLEHVSPEGKTFHSKKEMRQYEKDHNVELGALL